MVRYVSPSTARRAIIAALAVLALVVGAFANEEVQTEGELQSYVVATPG